MGENRALKNAYRYVNTNLNLPIQFPEDIMDNVSYSCDELIDEVKEDIALYGKEIECRLYLGKVENATVFTDYLIIGTDVLDEKDEYFTTSLQLNILMLQNSVLDADFEALNN